MPQATYYKLSEEKRQRVYDAVMNEYTRVPLEEVSVKKIVEEAGIPRGSFYQYFLDKEGALRHLVKTVHAMGEQQIFSETAGESLDLFSLLKSIFKHEVKMLTTHSVSKRAILLRQTAKSARGTAILFEEISRAILEDDQYKDYWKQAQLEHLSTIERDVTIDLLFTSLRQALLMIIIDVENTQQAEEMLNLKLKIIQQGVRSVMAIES